MNFVILNIQDSTGNILEIAHEFFEHHFQIATLTKTKKKTHGIETISNYTHMYSGVPEDQNIESDRQKKKTNSKLRGS